MTRGSVTRGSAVLATLAYIEGAHGADTRAQVTNALDDTLCARLSVLDATADVAYADLLALWRCADAVLRPLEPGWVERSGAHSIESTGVQLYGGILRKKSPHEFLTQSVSLFQLYYSPGDMQVVEEEGARAVLRLSGFDSQDPLFCRRQTGGLRQALLQAGGEEPRVKHVRCEHEGDAFCEWELSWRADVKEGGEGRGAGADE